MVRELEAEQVKEAEGNYVVLYMRGVGKYVGKVISVDVENHHMTYEVISGSNKGRTRTGKFAAGRPLKIYDEDAVVKALLDR